MDSSRAAVVVGLFVDLGIAAVYSHRKGNRRARTIFALLSVAGFALASAAFFGFFDAVPKVDPELRAGCEAGCSRDGEPNELCTAYCVCVLDALHERHSVRERDALLVGCGNPPP